MAKSLPVLGRETDRRGPAVGYAEAATRRASDGQVVGLTCRRVTVE